MSLWHTNRYCCYGMLDIGKHRSQNRVKRCRALKANVATSCPLVYPGHSHQTLVKFPLKIRAVARFTPPTSALIGRAVTTTAQHLRMLRATTLDSTEKHQGLVSIQIPVPQFDLPPC